MTTFDAGTAIYITATLKDKAGALIDPDSTKISIFDPSGTAKITDVAMTKVSTGVYDYTYQSAEADATGNYAIKIKAVSGSYTSIVKTKLFALESE